MMSPLQAPVLPTVLIETAVIPRAASKSAATIVELVAPVPVHVDKLTGV